MTKEWVMTDLDILSKSAEEIIKKMPPTGASMPDGPYLQNVGLQVMIVSQLEYFLKIHGKIHEQRQIVDIIAKSSLTQLEKDHLTYLFFARHTLVHNGGHVDQKFFSDIKKHTKELKLEEYQKDSLSSCSPERLPKYIHLIKKLIEEISYSN